MAVALPDQEARRTWSAVLDRARAELPETTFLMWFTDVRPTRLEDEVLSLAVPSQFVRERLQHNHLGLIATTATEVYGRPVKIHMEVDEAIRHEEAPAIDLTAPIDRAAAPAAFAAIGAPAPPAQVPAQAARTLGAPGLPFPNYTFDAFVPGPSSRFAHAAAMAVAEAPLSTAYNPLFIYGGTGLGKTHLLVAIGHHIWRLMPDTRIKYVTSEQFVTEFIKAVRERQGDAFRHKYREVDILLVDDIQFLAKREETQTEFFHTFNHLHGAGRQIVIASDRPPHELSGLEERLVSRFRWGLCVDVQPPDLETRIAILQLKAERENIPAVPSEVIEFVASKFDQSVRELEGALVRVVAWSELTRQPIDIELAERALQDLIPQTEHEIPPPLILEETATYFQLSTGDLVSKSRSRPLTQARHTAMYLMRECTGLSLVKIGEIFGGRDHTTALHGIKKVEDEMRSRDDTFRQVQDLTRIIRGRVRGIA
jgi:chromosomal replication initiator protein